MRKLILQTIDFFYPPFRRLLDQQTFRYGACGGFTTCLDIGIYFISYNFILQKQILDLGFIAISPYIAAFLMAFCISFPTGFLLSKYITFSQSDLRGRIQLFRYIVVVCINLCLNYFFLKLFVEVFHFYPTPSKIITTVFVVTFSYLAQKHYTFKSRG
jgi:putative flippase GtrA